VHFVCLALSYLGGLIDISGFLHVQSLVWAQMVVLMAPALETFLLGGQIARG
jgi:hypothetical protein